MLESAFLVQVRGFAGLLAYLLVGFCKHWF